MDETRVYTHVSGKALKGMKRLFKGRDIYISPTTSPDGYTVLTKPQKESRKAGIGAYAKRREHLTA